MTMRLRAKCVLILGISTGLTLSPGANAFDAGTIDDEPVQLDVTNATSVLYNANNRDSRPNDVTRAANDDWGLLYNRLNLQASTGKWQLGLRLDTAWFYTSPNAVDIATELERARPRPLAPGSLAPPDYFRQRFYEAGGELSNRYVNWTYPAKYYVGYTSRDVELTLGDFYAQFGRGLVLSVRKLDELSSDITIRGARATSHLDVDDAKLKLTLLGGEMNPLRLDEASGRYLGVTSDVTPGFLAITEAGMPHQVETDFIPSANPTYAPDRIVGAQVEAGPKQFTLGTQGVVLFRQDPLNSDTVRTAKHVFVGSQSLDIPRVGDFGAAYIEAAVQSLDGPANIDAGHALYASFNIFADPVTILLEGKHYRRFFPLSANVDLNHAREFNLVQYNAPPTTEVFYNDTQFETFNVCVSGGRAKTDFHAGKDEDLFVWLGYYNTWSESASNDQCDIADDKRNRVLDAAVGAELTSQQRKSRASITLGGRNDVADRELQTAGGEQTDIAYQEGYVRYDVIRWIDGPYSLQFQGWHRRRRQTLGGPEGGWWEGQHLTGFEWAPHVSLAFGVEYNSNELFAASDTASPSELSDVTLYFNGQATYRIDSASSVSLFVGQRRGSLRCVGGVCRVFPPFEGARLDATLRF
ncbi:MAG: hypothetical protein KC766_18835 [Myxococcales bacterium]|nr:hypothetical protein [Myxococcales bacterium]